MQPARRLEYVPDPNKFDLRTHYWDGSGNLQKKNLYTLYVIEGRAYYERPIKSGNLWFENNQAAGRVTFTPDGVRHIDERAAHLAFEPKLEGDDSIFYDLQQERAKNAELEAELAAIRSEKAPKVAAPVEEAPKASPSLSKKG